MDGAELYKKLQHASISRLYIISRMKEKPQRLYKLQHLSWCDRTDSIVEDYL